MSTTPKVVVYILCYDDASEASARAEYAQHPWATVLRIPDSPRTNKYMEGAAYLTLLPERKAEWQDADFVGTLSWRASSKIDVPDMNWLCAQMSHADVIGLLVLPEPMLAHAVRKHPRFAEVWLPLMESLGVEPKDACSPEIPGLMANFWLAKPRWMEAFCGFYSRAVTVMETRQDMQEALWSFPAYHSHLPESRCKEIYGRPYIPYHPFVGERLAGFYFWYMQTVLLLAPANSRQFMEANYGT